MDLLEAKRILNHNDFVLVEKSKYDGIPDSTVKIKDLISSLKNSGLEENINKAVVLEKKLVGLTEENLSEMQKAKKWKAEWTAKEKSLKGDLDDAAKYLADSLEADEALFFKVASNENRAGILLEKAVKVTSQEDVYALLARVCNEPEKVTTAKDLATQMAADFKKLLKSYYQRAIDAGWISVGDKVTTWKASYYDQDEEGNMSKFIAKKEMEKDREEWKEKSLKARGLKKESYELDEGFFGDIWAKIKSFGSWLLNSIFGEFKEVRTDTRQSLKDYNSLLLKIIAGCEEMLDYEV